MIEKRLGQGETPAEKALEEAIARVPGWEGRAALYAPLVGGLMNGNFRVALDGDARRYFIKVPGAGSEKFIDRKAAHAAADAGATSLDQVAEDSLAPPFKGEGNHGGSNDDLLTIVRRVEALGTFLDTEDGRNLLAGTRRAANILAAEQKKGTAVAASVDPALLREEAEKALFAAVNQAEKDAGEAIQKEDFSAAMLALSALREPVDSFFDKVLVNDEDQAVRANRLALLERIRAATGQVADFSKIAG